MRRPAPDPRRWLSSPRPLLARRAVIALIVVSSFGGLLTSANPNAVRADELSDAYAKQKQLQTLISRQKAAISSLAASQTALNAKLANTKQSLSAINANLLSVKTQIVSSTVEVAKAQNTVDELYATVAQLDADLARIESEEQAKEQQLEARKALLASRIREAYDTDRTSTLETLLSSDDFSDALTQVSDHLDFATQDKSLADQIIADQGVLDVMRQNVEIARQQAADLHKLADQQKAELDKQLAELNDAKKQLAKLEADTKALLDAQQAQYAKLASDKAKLAAMLAANQKAQQELEALIARLVREALARGGIPSVYNGTFQWPMSGRVTQEFGCTGFWAEPAYGGCSHFHRGIDIATTIYTHIYAAGPGKVIWSGKSPYDSAWIVIIAHSSHLVSWYGHVANGSHSPVVRAGQYVSKGQFIAYEGCTGMCTGPHLHWAVQLDGNWVNPRLFLPR